jgi:hypothetical protein
MRPSLASAAGVVVGVGLSLAMTTRPSGSAPRPPGEAARAGDAPGAKERPRAPEATPPRIPGRGRADELQGLRERIEALESRADDPPHGEPGPPRLTAAESRDLHVRENQQALERHRLEPIDRDWSRAASAAIDAALSSLTSDGDHRTVAVECKTTSCTATLEWQSFTQARGGYGAIMGRLGTVLDLPCGRSIVLPEPEEADRPYQATIVFDCQRW